eukprot:SAG22_NODE_56_length_23716_cov_11.146759_4_plen_79_part_00
MRADTPANGLQVLGRVRHCLSVVLPLALCCLRQRLSLRSNGLQVLGRNDNSWDQGQLFITQNMSYLAPAGVAQVLYRL